MASSMKKHSREVEGKKEEKKEGGGEEPVRCSEHSESNDEKEENEEIVFTSPLPSCLKVPPASGKSCDVNSAREFPRECTSLWSELT